MRTLAFPDRKILAGSTPVFDHGPVSRLYAESDQHRNDDERDPHRAATRTPAPAITRSRRSATVGQKVMLVPRTTARRRPPR